MLARLVVALTLSGCAGPAVVVRHPTYTGAAPCTNPPPGETVHVFAGAESTVPSTAGGLRLLDYSVDDRLSSPERRATFWGHSGYLLTVERDRAVVWDATSGVTVRSVRLPESIRDIEAVTADADLSRAACVVQKEGAGRVTALLGIDLVSGNARIVGDVSEGPRPFAFDERGEKLIVGGEIWETASWAHEATWVAPAPRRGVPLPHPRRVSVTDTMLEATIGNALPLAGPRLHQRVLPFGPRLLSYREAALDVTAAAHEAVFGTIPGSVTISGRDGTRDVRFDVDDADSIVVLSPSGRWVGTLGDSFTLRSTTSPEPLIRLQGTGWANRALLSDDGRTLVLGFQFTPMMVEQKVGSRRAVAGDAAAGVHRKAEAWDLTTGKRIARALDAFQVNSRLTPDGRFLWAPLSRTATDLRDGRATTFDRRIVAVSPEGVALLDDAWGGTKVVELASGRVVLEPRRRAPILAASHAGHVATQTPDYSLQLEAPGRCVRLLPGSWFFSTTFEQGSVMFSADASTLVAVAGRLNGPPREFVAWDASTGLERYSVVTPDLLETPLPLRELRVESVHVYPTPLSPPDVARIDVTNGRRIASPVELEGGGFADHPMPPLEGARSATAVSTDRRWMAVADRAGNFFVVTDDGSIVGRASFAERHDHVRFAWFSGIRSVSVQTARGGVFEFAIDETRPLRH